MNGLVIFIIAFLFCYATSWICYLNLNRGISKRSIHQQGFRFATTSILAALSAALAHQYLTIEAILSSTLVAGLWMVTYPLLYHLTNRKTASDYDHFMDITFGIYAWGCLTALHILSMAAPFWVPLIIAIELVMLAICIFQIGYYMMYDVCLDANGMKTIQETHINEIIEFYHSFHPAKVLSGLVAAIVAIVALCRWNLSISHSESLPTWLIVAEALLLVIYLYYLFFAKRNVFSRTGLVTLWRTIKDYKQRNYIYREKKEKRLQALEVSSAVPLNEERPQTIVMVIGESASRDYMSAFRPQPRETTPWLSELSKDSRHCLLIPNAYACANQTVPTLERALTERNQYNDKTFYDSCSIIDIVRKMGFATHWYSNQGHLGSADTPITLVAESCDVAKWTKQDLGKPQYDETLIDFLDELDPKKNNFLVLHLKGSHFNFTNRYPASYSEASRTADNTVEQYRTSLHYTDHVLQTAFEYCKERLNLSAMFYFSDHGDLPMGRRSPNFRGFGPVRIPMFIYCSDRYIAEHPDRYEAMVANKEKHFTNDLIYDFVCGLLDIQSDHFEPTDSFAYQSYRFTRDMLLTNEGRTPIREDDEQMYQEVGRK